jgi:glycosyltransferase involved in cell wall biosynthesis
MKNKVIYCAPIFGYPAIGGPELKALNILISMSNVYEVKLILWKEVKNAEFTRFLYERNIAVFYAERHKFKNLELQSRWLSGKALTAFRLFLHKLTFEVKQDRYKAAKSIISIAQQFNIDIVWFSYSNYYTAQFFMLKKHGTHLKLIADTDSVSSRYTLRGIPFVNYRKKLRLVINGIKEIRNEIRLVNNSDVLTAVSEVDLNFYSSLGASKNITLAYNVVNLEEYEIEKYVSPKTYLIITGSFGHFDSPMDHGTRWFIQKVWPLVKLELPGLKLRIVGKNSDIVWSELREGDIDVFGWVPDTKPHILAAAACIVPLWFESGTRYKILEAGILKTPVISTTLGAEGLQIQDEVELLIADQPEHFAQQVVRVVDTELGKYLSENLYKKVVEKYSINPLTQQIINAINLAFAKN